MNREEFVRILYGTVVPSNLSWEEQEKKYDEVNRFVSSELPERLFRYRRCDERSIEAFYKDQVWVSTSESMNDGFDARLFFDRRTINEWISNYFSDLALKNLVYNMIQAIPNRQKFCTPPGMEKTVEQIQSMNQEELEKKILVHWKEMQEDIAQALLEVAPVTQQALKFSCFSESISSAAMWGLYAADESGFALSYKFERCSFSTETGNGCSCQCTVFPVIYSNERYKVPDQFVQFLLQYRIMKKAFISSGYYAVFPEYSEQFLNRIICPDLFMGTKMALHKSLEWETEKEWRVFCTSNDDAEFIRTKHGCFIQTPAELYLGRRISEINQKILTDIAKEKGITVYKMRLNDDSPTYDLIGEET